MAGEFLVAGELNRRGIHTSVTYGGSKNADVLAFSSDSRRFARIEVKTTSEGNTKWILSQKLLSHENSGEGLFWVLVLLPEPPPSEPVEDPDLRGTHSPRYFVFSTRKLGDRIIELHEEYKAKYRDRHGREFEGPGVIQLPRKDATQYENRWDVIETYLDADA